MSDGDLFGSEGLKGVFPAQTGGGGKTEGGIFAGSREDLNAIQVGSKDGTVTVTSVPNHQQLAMKGPFRIESAAYTGDILKSFARKGELLLGLFVVFPFFLGGAFAGFLKRSPPGAPGYSREKPGVIRCW